MPFADDFAWYMYNDCGIVVDPNALPEEAVFVQFIDDLTAFFDDLEQDSRDDLDAAADGDDAANLLDPASVAEGYGDMLRDLDDLVGWPPSRVLSASARCIEAAHRGSREDAGDPAAASAEWASGSADPGGWPDSASG